MENKEEAVTETDKSIASFMTKRVERLAILAGPRDSLLKEITLLRALHCMLAHIHTTLPAIVPANTRHMSQAGEQHALGVFQDLNCLV